MSYKRTDRTSIKGTPVKNEETGKISIFFEDDSTLVEIEEVLEDYVDKVVRLTISYEEEQI